jgi:PIN domain nuclease of toxin-antitoxin system
MNVVLDASAMIAFLRGEPGSDVVERYFGPETHNLYAHALNLCEVYYDFLRAADEASAEGAVRDILLLGVRERNDMASDFWRSVGKLKAEHRRVSLADCCALALAGGLGAVLLSADRHELEPLAHASVCPVEFIR